MVKCKKIYMPKMGTGFIRDQSLFHELKMKIGVVNLYALAIYCFNVLK